MPNINIYMLIILHASVLLNAGAAQAGHNGNGPFILNENNTNIKNEIRTEANTGNNKAEEGEISEGNSSSKVKIDTEINGETVTDLDITEEKKGGVELKVKNEVVADSEKAETKTVIDRNSEVTSEEEVIYMYEEEFLGAGNGIESGGEDYVFGQEPAPNPENREANGQKAVVETADGSENTGQGVISAIIDFFVSIKNKIINIFL